LWRKGRYDGSFEGGFGGGVVVKEGGFIESSVDYGKKLKRKLD